MKDLVFGSYTPRWRHEKKIARNVLRQHTSHDNKAVYNLIDNEVGNIVTSFMKREGIPFDPHEDIFQAVGCIIFQLCFGDNRKCMKDKQFLEFIESVKIFAETAWAENPLDVMPYTEATILEVIPLSNVVPMGLPHSTTKDIVFRDYQIRKRTVVF